MEKYIRVKKNLNHISLTAMDEMGMEIGDDGREVNDFYGRAEAERLLSCLTNRQRRIASLLNEGKTRKEAAQELGISLQAVHQIIPRMRRRLREKAQVQGIQRKPAVSPVKNLVYLFFLTNGCPQAEGIHQVWMIHPVLRDYTPVPLEQLRQWHEEFTEEKTI